MVKQNKLIIWMIALIVVSASILSSCDTTFDPFLEKRALYSIYGYLGVNRDINYIRVKDLDSPLLADSTHKINAKVTLTNLSTGQTQILQDSVVRFHNIYTYNFRTTMDITPETKYRVRVTRSEGQSISATTITPPIAEINVSYNAITVNITFQPVHPKSRFRYTISAYPFDRPESTTKNFCAIFIQNRQFTGFKKVPGYCIPEHLSNNVNIRYLNIPKRFLLLPNDKLPSKFYLLYEHYAPGSFKPVTTTDSLSIPGGSGNFGAVYIDTLTIELP